MFNAYERHIIAVLLGRSTRPLSHFAKLHSPDVKHRNGKVLNEKYKSTICFLIETH